MWDHKVYAIDANKGQKIWEFETGSGVYSCRAVSNGVFYVGSDDNKLYALGRPGSLQPVLTQTFESTPIPMVPSQAPEPIPSTAIPTPSPPSPKTGYSQHFVGKLTSLTQFHTTIA